MAKFQPKTRAKMRVVCPNGRAYRLYRSTKTPEITNEQEIAYLRNHPQVEELGVDPYAGRTDTTTKKSQPPVQPAPKETAAKSLDDRIADAIEQLELDNPDHYTKGGKPQVKAIEAIIGEDITSADRDRVWEQFEVDEG